MSFSSQYCIIQESVIRLKALAVCKRAMAKSHARFVELEWIMPMPLTQGDKIGLRHLISGESSEEIAAALDCPLQAVRNCTHTLITWVLDELGEAETLIPSLASSPRILVHPHLGLSLPIRNMRSLTSWLIGVCLPLKLAGTSTSFAPAPGANEGACWG